MFELTEEFNVVYDPAHADVCQLDYYLPKTDRPCPVLIYMHAGSLEFGSRKGKVTKAFRWLVQQYGIAVATLDYRMYPNAAYPDFIEDAAKAVGSVVERGRTGAFSSYYICGSSAGGYLAMMLFFNPAYLGRYGLSSDDFRGFIFDAGQPTTHFNVLREHGIDTRAIRCDQTAPLFYLDHPYPHPEKQPEILILLAEHDLFNRAEQNHLLYRTLEHFEYDMDKVRLITLAGFSHCGYLHAQDPDGSYPWGKLLAEMIQKTR